MNKVIIKITMKICYVCNSSMERTIVQDSIIFKCSCGLEIKGSPEDFRIANKIYHSGELVEKSSKFIKFAAFDPTNNIIMRDCEKCGSDYMTQLRIGPEEIIIYVCKCEI